jgi:eukaryotic-like serine/threonine-protein kinase
VRPLIGQTLNQYRIEAQLGAGGMGVVYRALDTRLGRRVALKVLRPEIISDPDRKRRFVQEAQAASALNHPNIITIYDISVADDGTDFIAMEFVRGKTLDQLIGRKGMGLADALKSAAQVADALAKAHAAGIVHRDIKPGNIMVTDEGVVKILDFGIAKLSERVEDAIVTRSADGQPPPTEEGLILGTVPYMSPEQAQGKPVDPRSDIFSFGAVLYEILTGRQAFRRGNEISTLSAILREDPQPVTQLVEGIPRDAEKLVARCLRKDPGRRYQHMDDLKVALEELREELESGGFQTIPHAIKRRGPRWLFVAAGAAALSLAAAVWWIAFRSSTLMPTVQPNLVRLTSLPGIEQQPAVSPDGQQIAYSWNGTQGDNFDIYIQHVAGGAPLRLTTNVADDISPAWSPDGGRIAFVRQAPPGGTAVILIPSLGGPERRLIDLAFHGGMDRRLDWSPDGELLAIADRTAIKECEISLVSVTSGEKRVLASPPAGAICDNSPAFSPDGRRVVFVRWAGQAVGDLYIVATGGGEPQRLTFDNRQNRGPVWTIDGRSIVFSSERDGSQALWRIPVAGGDAQKIVDARGSEVMIGVSRQKESQESRLALEETIRDSNIWRVEASLDSAARRRPKRLIASTRQEVFPQYSPDGTKIAFASDRSGSWEIWVADSEGANAAQLTSFRSGNIGSPSWSPDSRRIVFDARPEGSPDLFVVNAEGGLARKLTTDPSEDTAPSWSNDGRRIYFASDRDGTQQVWKIPAEGGEPVRVTKGGGFASRESPDGKYLYYTKRRWAPGGLWRIPVNGGEESLFFEHLDPEYDRMWALTRDGVYFLQPDRPPRAAISFRPFATPRMTLSVPVDNSDHFAPGLSVSFDGHWILYSQIDQLNSDILLLEGVR